MLNSFPAALIVGTGLGFLAGLGVGGGSLLMIWLTLILNTTHPQARLTNLMFFIPCAVICSLFRWKQGKLNWAVVIPAIVAGCVSAGVFSWFSTQWDTGLLKKIFGILLLVTGARELFYKEKSRR